MLHAGNFALPERRGDFGGGAVERMGPTNVLVVLFEYDQASARTPLFARIDRPQPVPSDFAPNQLQRIIPGQSGAQYFYSEAGRAFCLYVVLGSHDGEDFAAHLAPLLGAGRSVAVLGFREFMSQRFRELAGQGLQIFDLEYEVKALPQRLPRLVPIQIDSFDPAAFL